MSSCVNNSKYATALIMWNGDNNTLIVFINLEHIIFEYFVLENKKSKLPGINSPCFL